MERILISQGDSLGQCKTHLWSIKASNICYTHQTLICNMCSSIFHFDWELEIKNGAAFVLEAVDTMKRLTEMIEYQGTNVLFDITIIWNWIQLYLIITVFEDVKSPPKQPSLCQTWRGLDKSDFYFSQIYNFLKKLVKIKF